MGNSATDALAGSTHISEGGQGERGGSGAHSASIVEEIGDWRGFLRCRQPWNELAERDPDATLLGHDWTAQAWKSLGSRARVLGVRGANGEWQGFAGLGWRRPRWLAFLAVARSQRLDAVGASPEIWSAVGRHLRCRRDWDVLDLEFLRPASAAWVRQLWPRCGLAVHERGEVRQHEIGLERPWAAIEAGFSPYLRANFQRRWKRLRALGDTQLQLHTRELQPHLSECFALESAGWKGQQGTAMAKNAGLHRFYRQLAYRLAARGRLHLYLLRLNQRVIAFELCVASPRSGRLYSLKIAYAEDLRTCSPGQVLRWMLLQDAREHFRHYEFLGDDAPWKSDWSTDLTTLRHLRIYNRTLRGQARRWRSQLYRHLPVR